MQHRRNERIDDRQLEGVVGGLAADTTSTTKQPQIADPIQIGNLEDDIRPEPDDGPGAIDDRSMDSSSIQ